MILADKIVKLRKKNGWSQEELAEKMNVSRQAVSKWESEQTVPDLEKILLLANLFGVTTDFLLKDEMEEEDCAALKECPAVMQIDMEAANEYLDVRRAASFRIAIATFLCILSPIALFVLGTAAEMGSIPLSETLAGVIGLAVLFAFVLCAVPIFIYCGFKNAPYEFLEKDVPFELTYGVKGLVETRRAAFAKCYMTCNIIAACICIFSPVPLVLSAFFENELLCVAMLAVTMIVAGIGVSIFIVVGVRNASFLKLLGEGEFSKREKKRNTVAESVGGAYWGVVVLIYLVWSFLSNDWHVTWLTFLVGGVLFPIVVGLCDFFFYGKSDQK